jgi:dolichyl-phosphate beta-glucosyltransferase
VRAIKDKRVYIHLTHIEHGKGFCVRTGVLGATTPLISFADADGATPAKELEKLIEAMESGNADVAIASRAVPGSAVHGKSAKRDLASYLFNLACRTLATPGIYDTQCGFKLFKKAAAHDIFSRQGILGFAFDVEILYLALRLGYNVKEVGVEWHDKAGSTVNVWRDAPGMFKDVLTIARQGRNGYYKNPCTTPKRIGWLDYKE